MKKQNSILLITALAAVVVFSACTSVKKELGVSRNSPDEFTVVKRAPLTLPPDYNLLPPLGKNSIDPRVIKTSTTSKAKSILLGDDGVAIESKGSADKTLLSKMQIESANPDIRNLIDKDNGYLALKNRSVMDKLVTSKEDVDVQAKMPQSVVDPQAEAERLKKNKTEGKAINEGVVPVIEKKQSALDKIF